MSVLFKKRARKYHKISSYEEYRTGILGSHVNTLRSIKRDLEAINTDGVLFDALADLQKVIDRVDFQVSVLSGQQVSSLAQPLPQPGMQPIVQNTLAQPSNQVAFPLS